MAFTCLSLGKGSWPTIILKIERNEYMDVVQQFGFDASSPLPFSVFPGGKIICYFVGKIGLGQCKLSFWAHQNGINLIQIFNFMKIMENTSVYP